MVGQKERLTKRQVEILECVSESRANRGYSPTIREIANHLGLSSVSTVAEHISSLEKKGLIHRERDRARSILLTRKGEALLSSRISRGQAIPLLGTIAAGEPIEANPIPDEIEVPKSLLGSGRHYALKVRGDSMIEEGILDGDYIIVEESKVAENGDTVVALIDGREATLKKFYREKFRRQPRIRLQPANPAMKPIILKPGERIEIQGKVRAVLRFL